MPCIKQLYKNRPGPHACMNIEMFPSSYIGRNLGTYYPVVHWSTSRVLQVPDSLDVNKVRSRSRRKTQLAYTLTLFHSASLVSSHCPSSSLASFRTWCIWWNVIDSWSRTWFVDFRLGDVGSHVWVVDSKVSTVKSQGQDSSKTQLFIRKISVHLVRSN